MLREPETEGGKMSNRLLLTLALILLGVLVFSYSNHFDNGFYFDDAHTIVSKAAIRDLGNIPRFFTDASTFSSLPANHAYRPVVTTLNAIDHWMGNGLDPFFFHLSIFVAYVLQCVLQFFVYRRILDLSYPHDWNSAIAMAMVAFYSLHTANAETINYIIARSDSFSTLGVVAALFLYQIPAARRSQVYLLALVVGLYTKQTAVMFAPILFAYILLFEERIEFAHFGQKEGLRRVLRSAVQAAPATVLATVIFVVNQFFFTPDSTVSMNAEVSRFDYFATQFFVITHYLGNFVLPINLSADPDFEVIVGFLDFRLILGLIAMGSLITLAILAFASIKTRPIAFGLVWFFLALAPTSSFVPLFQVGNDHRTFFPYVGLVLSVGWGLGLFAISCRSLLSGRRWALKAAGAVLLTVLLSHAYGTHRRNEVWGSGESLWHDVTIKSPLNARGLMNYGVSQMSKGRFTVARSYFERALEIWPYYSYLHTNLGVLNGALDNDAEAERYFRNGVRYGRMIPDAYYFFAKWLQEGGRLKEAEALLEQALEVSSGHAGSLALFDGVRAELEEGRRARLSELIHLVESEPTPENLLDLSLAHYEDGNYLECIRTAERALELAPRYTPAYNNICSSFIKLGELDQAINACGKALEIDPDYELARNNLRWALGEKEARNVRY